MFRGTSLYTHPASAEAESLGGHNVKHPPLFVHVGQRQRALDEREREWQALLRKLLLKDGHDLGLARLHPVQPRIQRPLVLRSRDDGGVAYDKALVVAEEERGRGDGPAREEVAT